jgi:signal transduction histidine kinase
MEQRATPRANRPTPLHAGFADGSWSEQLRRRLRQTAAFAGSVEPRSQVSRHALRSDFALAAVLTLTVMIITGRAGSQLAAGPAVPFGGSRVGDGSGVQAALLAAVTTAPLAVRRYRPLTAFWVIFLAAAASPHYAANLVTLAAFVLAAYSAVAYSRFRGAALVSMPAAAFLLATYLGAHTGAKLPQSGAAIMVLVPILVAANAMHRWRRNAADSKARMISLQAEHEAAMREALELERARIASELHDVVTHNVSVMIVQAGAARQVLDEAPADARAALLAVESSGRAAMAELRHLLGLLSPVTAAADEALNGQPPAEYAPQPGLGQLSMLIGRVQAAGLPVEAQVSSLQPGLPAGLDLAAYRVVQEALTNVIKHAGKPSTRVRVDCCDGELVIEVADDGRPIPAAGPVAPAGSGRGLLGLRERIALYGGDLTAGPRPGGGWLVRARLPVDLPAAALPGQGLPGAASRASVPVPQ